MHTIGEAANILGVPASTLRYYESEGLLGELARTEGGRRRLSDKDLEACRVIACLKSSGLSISDIRGFMRMVAEGDATLADRKALFEARRAALLQEMAEMQGVLDVLDFKCWYYGTAAAAGTEDAVRDLPESKIPAQYRKGRAHLRGIEP